jgi:predicted metalloprotease with PDZ domain
VLAAIGPDFKKSWLQFKAHYIEGTHDLPLAQWFTAQGIVVTDKKMSLLEHMKLQWAMRYSDQNGWVKVTHVLDGGIAQRAGLAPGDVLASINGQRISSNRLDAVFAQLQMGTNARLRFYRQDCEHESQFILEPSSPVMQYQLSKK